jgi:Rps23 Pro-64 3,4-dihydroxylase Tpa1-like proline 4-hydroxylase
MTSDFRFDPERLRNLARERAGQYRSASPFPYVVLDDFLPKAVIEACIAEFPGPEAIPWDVYTDEGNTLKLATPDQSLMGSQTRGVVDEFNGPAMLAFLEELTGIGGLLPDPYLAGGGLHQIEPGGFLRVHADFNRHAKFDLDRRINILLFLNPEWREEYAGHLELWDRTMTRREQRILPLANRCVIFNTTDDAYHGHPEPLSCPDGMSRKSLAFYYYSNGRPEEERSVAHSTLYQTPGQAPVAAAAPEHTSRLRSAARRLLPPALLALIRRMRSGRAA